MQEGFYSGKVLDYGITGQEQKPDGSVKAPQVYVKMSVNMNESVMQMTWFGGFKPLQQGKQTSQMAVTVQTILDLGFKGNSFAEMAKGSGSNLIDMSKEFNVKVEFQKDQMGNVKVDASGSPKFRIANIYDPNASSMKGQVDFGTAQGQLAQLGIDNELMKQRSERGGQANVNNNQAQNMNQNINNGAGNGTVQNQNVNNSQNMNQGMSQNQNANNNQDQMNFNNGQNMNQNVNMNNGQNIPISDIPF